MNRPKRKGSRHPKSPSSSETAPKPRPQPTDSADVQRRCAIPGEFEPQEALVFGCGQLVRFYPQLFVDFVRRSHERVRLIGMIAPEWRRLGDLLLGAAGLPIDAVEFVEAMTTSVWARDWSPMVGYDAEGNRCQYYLERGHMRHRDDLAARKVFQSQFSDPAKEVPLSMEGGNILSNGQGLILTSNTVAQANASRFGPGEISKLFESTFFAGQWASLVQLHGERTGHVDLFATFLAPDFLLIGSVDERDDELSARTLNDAAEKLNGLQTSAGKLQVERIPMPSSRDTYFRSYNNVIFANQLLLVPTYPDLDPKLDERALAIYRELLPGWEVVGLNLSSMAKKGGGLHCLSANVPPAVRAQPLAARVA